MHNEIDSLHRALSKTTSFHILIYIYYIYISIPCNIKAFVIIKTFDIIREVTFLIFRVDLCYQDT